MRPLELLLVAVVAALAGCAGVLNPGSGPAVDAPVYRVGDRWVYRGDDGFREKARWEETHEIVAIDPNGISVRITQKGRSIDVTRVESWTSPGQVAVGAVYANETRRFATPLLQYAFPLAEGRIWNQRVDNYNEATRNTGSISRYVHVRGSEQVTTAAGVFDAVSLWVVMQLDDDTFWRTATECAYRIWYAPAVRGVVRAELNAGYREKDGAMDGGGGVPTQHTVLELLAFVPGTT